MNKVQVRINKGHDHYNSNCAGQRKKLEVFERYARQEIGLFPEECQQFAQQAADGLKDEQVNCDDFYLWYFYIYTNDAQYNYKQKG